MTVTKAWNNSNNQDGLRLNSIQVQLYADGVAHGNPVELNKNNNWTTNWTELEEKQNGKAIDYMVKELDTLNEYTVTINNTDKGNKIITNTHTSNNIDKSGDKTTNNQSATNKTEGNKTTASQTKNKPLPNTGEKNNRFNFIGELLLVTISTCILISI